MQEVGTRTANGEQRVPAPKEIAPMKTTRPLLLLVLSLPALALTGCAPKPTLVGKWQGTVSQPGRTMNTLFEFTPDNKETVTVTAAGTPLSVVIHGTYTVDGGNLAQTFTTMTVGGQIRPAPASSSSPRPFTLDGDHLALSDPTGKQSLTLTRVKP